jgi:plasmid maintenance system antidote protein VapI
MKKMLVLGLLLLSITPRTYPLGLTRIMFGATATAITIGVAYHIWSHYNITRNLRRYFTEGLNSTEERLRTRLDHTDESITHLHNKANLTLEKLDKLEHMTQEIKEAIMALSQNQYNASSYLRFIR